MNSAVMSAFSWKNDPSLLRRFTFSNLTNSPTPGMVRRFPVQTFVRPGSKQISNSVFSSNANAFADEEMPSTSRNMTSIPSNAVEERPSEITMNSSENRNMIPAVDQELTETYALEEAETGEEAAAVAGSSISAAESVEDPFTLPTVELLTAGNLLRQNMAKPSLSVKTYDQNLTDQSNYQNVEQSSEMGIVGTTLGASIAGPVGAVVGDAIGSLLPTNKLTISTTTGNKDLT